MAKILFNRFIRCRCVLSFPKQEVRGPGIAKVLFNRFKRCQRVLISPKQEVRGLDIAKVLFNRFKRYQCMLISSKQEIRGPGVTKVLFNRFKRLEDTNIFLSKQKFLQGNCANRFFIHALILGFFLQWEFGEPSYQTRENQPFDKCTGHILNVGSPQNCAPFSNPPHVISISKYRPEWKLSYDNNCVFLEIMGKLSCSIHHCQNDLLEGLLLIRA